MVYARVPSEELWFGAEEQRERGAIDPKGSSETDCYVKDLKEGESRRRQRTRNTSMMDSSPARGDELGLIPPIGGGVMTVTY